MKPVEFEGQDCLLVQTTIGHSMDSYWRPSPEELEQLNKGAHVRLSVYGHRHPPVWIDVEKVEELP